MSEVSKLKACRACGNQQLVFVGSLGTQYVVGFPKCSDEKSGLQTPLNLLLCTNCKLLQLEHMVAPDRLFRNFWYRSSINEFMRAALADVVKKAIDVVGGLDCGDSVCDIGSNDGTLLANYHRSIHTVGFEPCKEMANIDCTSDILISDYFPSSLDLKDRRERWRKPGCKIITAIAMFYDVNDPRQFLTDVKKLLHPEGVFVLQMNHLRAMISDCTFDNIAQEHLCYYSFKTLEKVLNTAGLRVRDVEENGVNGGSLRVYVSHKETIPKGLADRLDECNARIERLCKAEIEEKISDTGTISSFFWRQHTVSKILSRCIRELTAQGKKVYVYGASTRGTVILQTLDEDVWPMLCGAADRDERKMGRMMVGTWTPIVSETEGRKKADYFLVLPYGFLSGFLEREKEWMGKGGKIIVPLPIPKIIRRKTELIVEEL